MAFAGLLAWETGTRVLIDWIIGGVRYPRGLRCSGGSVRPYTFCKKLDWPGAQKYKHGTAATHWSCRSISRTLRGIFLAYQSALLSACCMSLRSLFLLQNQIVGHDALCLPTLPSFVPSAAERIALRRFRRGVRECRIVRQLLVSNVLFSRLYCTRTILKSDMAIESCTRYSTEDAYVSQKGQA